MNLSIASTVQSRAFAIAMPAVPRTTTAITPGAQATGPTAVSLRRADPLAPLRKASAAELNEARKLVRSAGRQYDDLQTAREEAQTLRQEAMRLKGELQNLVGQAAQQAQQPKSEGFLEGIVHSIFGGSKKSQEPSPELQRRIEETRSKLLSTESQLKEKQREAGDRAATLTGTLNAAMETSGHDPRVDALLQKVQGASPQNAHRWLNDAGQLLDQRWREAKLSESVWMGPMAERRAAVEAR